MGNPRAFCESDAEIQELLKATLAIYEIEHAWPQTLEPSHPPREIQTKRSAGTRFTASRAGFFKLLKKISSFRHFVTEAKGPRQPSELPVLGRGARPGLREKTESGEKAGSRSYFQTG